MQGAVLFSAARGPEVHCADAVFDGYESTFVADLLELLGADQSLVDDVMDAADMIGDEYHIIISREPQTGGFVRVDAPPLELWGWWRVVS